VEEGVAGNLGRPAGSVVDIIALEGNHLGNVSVAVNVCCQPQLTSLEPVK
jgi:hypothetical protein